MRERLATPLLDQGGRFCDFRFAASAAQHGSASLCVGDGNGATDTATGAGDDGDLTLERGGIGLVHGLFPFCL
ncbi:hypothetical protein D3C80_984440 [compost metagenome]